MSGGGHTKGGGVKWWLAENDSGGDEFLKLGSFGGVKVRM